MTDNAYLCLDFERSSARVLSRAELIDAQIACLCARRLLPLADARVQDNESRGLSPNDARAEAYRWYSQPTTDARLGHLGLLWGTPAQIPQVLGEAVACSRRLFAAACQVVPRILPENQALQIVLAALLATPDPMREHFYALARRSQALVRLYRREQDQKPDPSVPQRGKVPCFDFQTPAIAWISPYGYGYCAAALAHRIGFDAAFWRLVNRRQRQSPDFLSGDYGQLLAEAAQKRFNPLTAESLPPGHRGFAPLSPGTALALAAALPAAPRDAMTTLLIQHWSQFQQFARVYGDPATELARARERDAPGLAHAVRLWRRQERETTPADPSPRLGERE